MLAAAVVGPLTGNSCPGDGSMPFVGCPAGLYCPTPAQRLLCPAVSKLHCKVYKPTGNTPPEVLHQTLGPLTMRLFTVQDFPSCCKSPQNCARQVIVPSGMAAKLSDA